MPAEKRIFIIAGPNGAGKTTFALEFLPREADCPDFINVDLIAAGLSPLIPTGPPFARAGLCLRKSAIEFAMGKASLSRRR